MNIADRILYLRKSKGISQEELADKVGVSRQAVSKWESEQSMPDVEKIIIMSDYFNVTTDYILKGIEVELEHTDSPAEALEITLDHSAETVKETGEYNYYTDYLLPMEESMGND